MKLGLQALLALAVIFGCAIVSGATSGDADAGVRIDIGIRVIYTEFSASVETTNFAVMDDTELQTIADMTLENAYGKIIFSEDINLTEVVEANAVDLDAYIEISDGSIYVNITHFPNLETSATLYLYGLTFTSPAILRDGAACGTDCGIISYASGNLIFTVSNVSADYRIIESTAEEALQGGGGGGGGTEIAAPFNFTIDYETIEIGLAPGESARENFTIANTGSMTENYSIIITDGSKGYLAMDVMEFSLQPGESRIVFVDVLIPVNEKSELYLARISVRSGSIVRNVMLVVNIVQEEKPFVIRIITSLSWFSVILLVLLLLMWGIIILLLKRRKDRKKKDRNRAARKGYTTSI